MGDILLVVYMAFGRIDYPVEILLRLYGVTIGIAVG